MLRAKHLAFHVTALRIGGSKSGSGNEAADLAPIFQIPNADAPIKATRAETFCLDTGSQRDGPVGMPTELMDFLTVLHLVLPDYPVRRRTEQLVLCHQ